MAKDEKQKQEQPQKAAPDGTWRQKLDESEATIAALRDALQREKKRADDAVETSDRWQKTFQQADKEAAKQMATALGWPENAETDWSLMVGEVAGLKEKIRTLTTHEGPGSVFSQGRAEGRADVAAQLRALLDPSDAQHWDLDGLLSEVETIIGASHILTKEMGSTKDLVKAVPVKDRLPLLGDLLALLKMVAGETGANETATDILRRKVTEATGLSLELAELKKRYDVLGQHYRASQAEVSELKTALVARRAPDAGAGAVVEQLAARFQALGFNVPHGPDTGGAVVERVWAIVAEWQGLRAFLSPQPLVAVAVRDDSTEELKERYSLILMDWDGKKLRTTVSGERRPWSELTRPMATAVGKTLVPKTYR